MNFIEEQQTKARFMMLPLSCEQSPAEEKKINKIVSSVIEATAKYIIKRVAKNSPCKLNRGEEGPCCVPQDCWKCGLDNLIKQATEGARDEDS